MCSSLLLALSLFLPWLDFAFTTAMAVAAAAAAPAAAAPQALLPLLLLWLMASHSGNNSLQHGVSITKTARYMHAHSRGLRLNRFLQYSCRLARGLHGAIRRAAMHEFAFGWVDCFKERMAKRTQASTNLVASIARCFSFHKARCVTTIFKCLEVC